MTKIGIEQNESSRIMEHLKGKKIYDIEHAPTYGDMRVSIDFDFIWYYGEKKMTMQDTILTMVEFWYGYEARLSSNESNYLNTFLKHLCQEVLLVAFQGNYNKKGVIDQFKNKEGWMDLDGSHGITLITIGTMELDNQDDYIIKEIETAKTKKIEAAALLEKAIPLAELFSDFFKEDKFNLSDMMNDIIIRDKGVIELNMRASGELILFDVALSEERECITQLVPDIEAYTLECKKRYAHSDDDNVFNFALAVEFYSKFFDGSIEYDKASGSFYIRKK